MWIDLTFADRPANVTRAAHALSLTTEIILKVPAWKMTVMRVVGPREQLSQFIEQKFPACTPAHLAVMREEAPKRELLKNRMLRLSEESREVV